MHNFLSPVLIMKGPKGGLRSTLTTDWQQICNLLWETCCQSVVSVDLRPPLGPFIISTGERKLCIFGYSAHTTLKQINIAKQLCLERGEIACGPL